MDVATEDAEEFCIVSHVGDGMTHSTAHPSNFCLSPCQQFRLSCFHGSTIIKHGLVYVPSDVLCHCFVDCIAGP